MKYAKKLIVLPVDRYQEMRRKLQAMEGGQNASLLQESATPETQSAVKDNHCQETLSVPYNQSSPSQDMPEHAYKTVTSNELDTGCILDAERIVQTLGKPFRHKARELLKYIERSGREQLTWDNKGEVINNGEHIKGSNIINLLRGIMYKKCKNMAYVGQRELEDLLIETNVPLSLIGNVEIRDQLKKANCDLKTLSKDIGIVKKRKDIGIVKKRKLYTKRIGGNKKWVTL